MRLLAIPRTLFAKCAGQCVQACHLAGHRLGKLWNVQRREVIGHQLVRALEPIEFVPRGVEHAFVGKAEMMQHHHAFVTTGRFVCEFHLRQHPIGMALGNQERSGAIGGCLGEAMGIHHSYAGIDRIDAEPQPCQVEKAHGGQHANIQPFVGEQSTNTVFQHAG